jgi:hypothetical protein
MSEVFDIRDARIRIKELEAHVSMLSEALEGCKGAYKHGIAWNLKLHEALSATSSEVEQHMKAIKQDSRLEGLLEAIGVCQELQQTWGTAGECADEILRIASELKECESDIDQATRLE